VEKIIPKVHVVTGFLWKDGHDEMIFGRLRGEHTRVWLNFVNARRVIG
jgi:hypothetical protein